jgi:hypothetical protein
MYKESIDEIDSNLLSDFLDSDDESKIVEPKGHSDAKKAKKKADADPRRKVINIRTVKNKRFVPNGATDFVKSGLGEDKSAFPSLGNDGPTDFTDPELDMFKEAMAVSAEPAKVEYGSAIIQTTSNVPKKKKGRREIKNEEVDTVDVTDFFEKIPEPKKPEKFENKAENQFQFDPTANLFSLGDMLENPKKTEPEPIPEV